MEMEDPRPIGVALCGQRLARLLMRPGLLIGLVLVFSAVIAPESVKYDYSDDPRILRLRSLFERTKAPAKEYAVEFLLAADHHDLDWRLLPSIAMVETGAGKYAHNNNILGWANGRIDFPTEEVGIHRVAERLANSKLYKNKDLAGILRTYNTGQQYPRAVRSFMNALGPE